MKGGFLNSWAIAECSVLSYKRQKERKKKASYMRELFWEGSRLVNWLLYSVVLQCRLLSPNQCEILKFQKRTTELCDPCTVLFVLFIGFTIQRCWKTVLISSINMSFYYSTLSPLPLYFVLFFIGFMLTNCTFFIQTVYFYFWSKKSVMWKPNLAMSTLIINSDHLQQLMSGNLYQ